MPATIRRAVAAALLALGMLPSVSGQARAERDVGAPAPATIAGRVDLESDGQRAPLRRATVTLRRDRGEETWTTATDADGRYQFENVIAGSYRVQSIKAGFVPAASNGPSAAPAAAPVEVKDGAAPTVNLVMQRAGAVEGRFLDDRGFPITRLTVTADRLPDGTASDAESFSAKTDDLGRFRVHTLPPGRYRVHATPPPPASGEELFYPGTSSPDDASILTIAAGQTLDHLEITVPTAPLSPIAAAAVTAFASDTTNAPPAPGATSQISGRITRSDTGQPVPNATAELASAPVSVASGQFTFPSIRRVISADSDGRFQFNNVAAGNYTLTANADGFAGEEGFTRWQPPHAPIVIKAGDRASRDLVLTPTSAIEVRVLDEFGDPAPAIVLQVSRRAFLAGASRFVPDGGGATTGITDDRGWFRVSGLFPGDYYLLAVPEPFARSGPAAFAMTFFPGTASPLAATPVRLSAGRDALNVTFSIGAAHAAMIAGLAIDNTGLPVADAQVMLLATHDGELQTEAMAKTKTGMDGSFSYQGVPEGTYALQGWGRSSFGSTPVVILAVPTRAPQPVVLTLKSHTTSRGRVIFEGGAPSPKELEGLRVAYVQTDFALGPAGGTAMEPARVAPDGRFEISMPASPGILVPLAPPGWVLARVLLQGRDITYRPYDFQSAGVDGIEVVLTNRVGSISGTLVAAGQPVADTSVVVFGADATTWMHLALTLRGGVTNAQGVFNIGELLPGRYLALALPSQTRQYLDPTSLLALRSVATQVVVTEGATATVRLALIK